MSKCSRVCGLIDSSAAITKTTKSMPATPASMFLMNLSWPGTSIRATRRSRAKSRCANPRSIDMPRRFSSSRRSVSIPVSARTRLVFPWSMWPAVPAITCFTLLLLLVSPGKAQDGDITFKSGVANVRVDVQVIQDGELITGLPHRISWFARMTSPQPIVYFGREKEPLSLLLFLDVSGSMRKYVEQVAASPGSRCVF